jgi:hypothetical protein
MSQNLKLFLLLAWLVIASLSTGVVSLFFLFIAHSQWSHFRLLGSHPSDLRTGPLRCIMVLSQTYKLRCLWSIINTHRNCNYNGSFSSHHRRKIVAAAFTYKPLVRSVVHNTSALLSLYLRLVDCFTVWPLPYFAKPSEIETITLFYNVGKTFPLNF